MKTSDKAEVATLKIQLRALEKGAIVSKPVVEGTRYDLVLDYCGRLYRVQVKYADGESQNGATFVRLTAGSYGKVRFHSYSSIEVDAILVYVPKQDVVLWIEPSLFEGKRSLSFRLQKSLNNQTKGCCELADYIW